MKKIPITLGIDIGGTSTKYGLVDVDGNFYGEGSIPTYAELPASALLARLFEAIDPLLQNAPTPVELLGVGVGAPNANYYKGTVEQPANLMWDKVTPLADMIQKHYQVPVFITNDANAAAIGEEIFGAAKGMKNFVVVTLGTGLGSGIVVNGELVYGADGFAGEMGHTTVDPDGRDHGSTGLRGGLENYVSATGIKRTVFELLAKRTQPSPLRDVSYNQMTSLQIAQAAEQGDLIALEAFDVTARILGMKLAETVAYLSPEAIILFGGLVASGSLILEPTKRYMEDYLLKVFKNKIPLLPSALMDKNAAVLGASALIWGELRKMKK